jgi:hypothetical protein
MNKNNIRRIITSNIKRVTRYHDSETNMLEDHILTNEKIAQRFVKSVYLNSETTRVQKNVLSGFDFMYKSELDNNHGSGPLRLISESDFSLRSTFTLDHIRLTKGMLGGKRTNLFMSKELSELIDAISEDFSKNGCGNLFNLDDNEVSLEKFSLLQEGCAIFTSGYIDINNKATYTKFLISNIRRDIGSKDRNEYGDISVHMLRALGKGDAFLFERIEGYTQKEVDAFNAMRTVDLFNPSNLFQEQVSKNFKDKLNNSKDAFQVQAKMYKGLLRQVSSVDPYMREHHMITMANNIYGS